MAVKLLELRLGLSKDLNMAGLLQQAMGNAFSNSIASRVTSSTASAAIVQGGKIKRVGSVVEGKRRRQSSGDEEDIDDDGFWNELDEMNGQMKSESEPTIQDSPTRGRSSQGNRPQSRSGIASGQVLSATQRREVEEQLAETLYRRAQAKMMLPIHEDSVIESALMDAWRVSLKPYILCEIFFFHNIINITNCQAIKFIDDDDDFHLLAATCLIRLHRYEEAVKILEYVLQRSPHNMKAVYNLSFCRRAEGYQKDAIQGLTKVN